MLRARAIVLNNSGQVLLGHNHYDEWVLLGGGIKNGEHPVDAIVREVEEESGYKIEAKNLEYLWFYLDNYVFLYEMPQMQEMLAPSVLKDPCCELMDLRWFSLDSLPTLNPYAEDILYRFLRKEILSQEATSIEAGRIDVLVDGKKVYELDDDEIWVTLPKLTQERSKGRRIDFRQVLDDGTIIDQKTNPMPVSADLGAIKINKILDELFCEWLPEEKMRPMVEVVSDASFLGKTVWRKRDGLAPIITIIVNCKVIGSDAILKQVLAHEMIHAHLYHKYGNSVAKHGEHFNWLAQKINDKMGKNYISKYADNTNFKG